MKKEANNSLLLFPLGKKELIFIISFIFLVGFVSADFDVGNLSHKLTKTVYAEEANIEGWINISLDAESASSIFKDSRGNTIRLLELLNSDSNLREGRDFDCSITDCKTDYSASNAQSTKTFTLKTGQSKLIGIVFDQDLSSINSIKFNVSSNAPASCENQIEIDFLSDGTIDRGNTHMANIACSDLKDYGCFNYSTSSSSVNIEKLPKMHCEKIEFPIAPGFHIGANITRGTFTDNITMALYTSSGESITNAKCNLPIASGEQFCLIEYPIFEEKEYLVCIYRDKDAAIPPQIRGYSLGDSTCGYYYNDVTKKGGAFSIFMEPRGFNSVGIIPLENDIGKTKTLAQTIQNYIVSKYGSNMRCGTNNCIVPIKISSNTNQNITINGISIAYDLDIGSGSSQNKLSDLVESPSLIDSDFIKISLNKGNFSVRENPGNQTFKLELDGHKIFSEVISVQKMATVTGIYPTTFAQGFPTEITAYVDFPENSSSFTWYFGDGNKSTATTKKVTHTYAEKGTYTLSVAVGSGTKISNSSFEIKVVSPRDAINHTLSTLQKNLEKINDQIEDFDAVSQKMLKLYLNLDSAEGNLSEIQKAYAQANTDEEYLKIVGQLLTLNIPSIILKTAEAKNIDYFPNEEVINLEMLKIVGGGDYEIDKTEKYKVAVLLWGQENLESKINYRKFNSEKGPLLNVFELSLSGNLAENPSYIIIKDMENIKFAEDYGEIKESGYYYIELTDLPETISLSTTENVNFATLPLFVSASLDALPGIEEISESKTKEIRWAIMGLVLFLLILIGIGIYLFMQVWYKKKYEAYLFKNKNHLYNIANYINNEKKQGKEDKNIIKSLKSAGWNSEQVSYAMKKYAGKRTGMYELPIGKALQFLEKKNAPTPPMRNDMQRPSLPKNMEKKFFVEDKFKRY